MARSNKKLTPTASEKLLSAYLAFFESDNGRLVLADLKQLYHDRCSTIVDYDPNRALASEAARGVYLGILAMIREAKKHATGRNSDNDTAEFDLDSGIDAAGAAIWNQ